MKLIMENWKKFVNEQERFRGSTTMEAVGLKGEVIKLTILDPDPEAEFPGREVILKSELGSNDLGMGAGPGTPMVDKIKMAMESYVEDVYGGKNSEQNLQAMIKKNAQLLSHISNSTVYR